MTKVYAAYTKNNELLESSSSGGIFIELAEKIIASGGAVACTVYNFEKNKAEFILDKTGEMLKKASGSKYIQSDTDGIFRKSEEFLKTNPKGRLMFIGTGCQADGFRRFAEKRGFRDRTIIADLICFGVNSPQFWHDTAEYYEKKYGGSIEDISFRCKKNGWEKSTAVMTINGREVSLKNYMRLYFQRCMLRPSCYRCPYTKVERNTDITIGDYWGVKEVMPDFYNPRGTSLVLIHSEAGQELFDSVSSSLHFKESNDTDCLQPALKSPQPLSSCRTDFWADYRKNGAEYVLNRTAKYSIEYHRKAKAVHEAVSGHDPRRAAEIITGQMSLKEKICQMFIVAPESLASRRKVNFISDFTQKKYPIGGVCYYAYNLDSVEQTLNMTDGFQNASLNSVGIGMFICVDEEGGTVTRTSKKLGTTAFDDMMIYGAAGDEGVVYNIGKTLAADLTGLGFNVNFAPVADVYSEGKSEFLKKRCFSDDPEVVSRMITAEINGMNDGGVICAPKHFPGHGSASGNSHDGIVINDRPRDELERIDIKPFLAAIKAGAPMIMVGHIVTECIDPELPASLSPKAIKELLRKETGYEGIIICDAIRMKAIRNKYGFGKAVAKAISAGCDIVLGVLSIQEALYAVKKEIRRGSISEEQINRSVERIIEAKIRYGVIDVRLAIRGSCSGCSACEAVCPSGAVSMTQDREGFYYPSVDRNKCTGCRRCVEICSTAEYLNSRLSGGGY